MQLVSIETFYISIIYWLIQFFRSRSRSQSHLFFNTRSWWFPYNIWTTLFSQQSTRNNRRRWTSWKESWLHMVKNNVQNVMTTKKETHRRDRRWLDRDKLLQALNAKRPKLYNSVVCAPLGSPSPLTSIFLLLCICTTIFNKMTIFIYSFRSYPQCNMQCIFGGKHMSNIKHNEVESGIDFFFMGALRLNWVWYKYYLTPILQNVSLDPTSSCDGFK